MVTIEAMIWSIRIGEDNHSFYDPYTSICTATRAGIDTVRITALAGDPAHPLTLKQSIQIAKILKGLGFSWAIWERIKDGKLVDVKRRL